MKAMARRRQRTWLGFERRDWFIAIQVGLALVLFAWAASAGAIAIGGGS